MSFSDKLGDAIILTRPPFFINELIPLYICEKIDEEKNQLLYHIDYPRSKLEYKISLLYHLYNFYILFLNLSLSSS